MTRTTYQVVARQWAHGWELHIDGVGVTQARVLTEAESQVRDHIALDLGVEPDSFDVVINPTVDGLDTVIAQAREETRAAEKALRRSAERARTVAHLLRSKGLTGRETAMILGVSPQRVSQLLKPRQIMPIDPYLLGGPDIGDPEIMAQARP